MSSKGHQKGNAYSLKSTDLAVLHYLSKMANLVGGDTCTVGIPSISEACEISERQVQISAKRLIQARAIKRIGYDLSNPDKAKRGTIYKVLTKRKKDREQQLQEARTGLITCLLDTCSTLQDFIKQLLTIDEIGAVQMNEETLILKRIQKEMIKLRAIS